MIKVNRIDSYVNKCRGIGVNEDINSIKLNVLNIDALRAIYSSDGIGKRIIDIKSEDMIRQWISIEKDTDGNILEALDGINAKSVFLRALQLNKTYGGSIIFMMIDDAGQAEDELNINNIKSIEKIKAFSREKFTTVAYDDFGEPSIFEIQTKDKSVRVHSSRCLVFTGDLCLYEYNYEMQDMEYWGFSELQSMFNILGKLGLSLQSIFDMLIKSNIDVLKIEKLWEKLGINNKEGQSQLDKRLEAFDKGKSVSRTLMIDNLEDYQTISQNYSGVPEVMDRMKEFLSLISGIAVTILWGTSSKGLNSTGDNDVRRYYDSIKNDQELTLRKPLAYLIKLLSLSKDLSIANKENNFEFNSLWQLSQKEEAEIKKITAETDQIYINNGVLDPSEIRQARFGGEKYSSDILIKGDIEIEEEELIENSNNTNNDKSDNKGSILSKWFKKD